MPPQSTKRIPVGLLASPFSSFF